ncbi:Retrovirus-related Pol polyprotein from transposon TNT 1-94 [Araneus ventricosus]|uniref:Retrovirus-related Pol polyprotein from transposon TNT 1-94 n=1 Tax=Araneus ventricosus TaxID=182803 RepID=A0A4Y2R8R8_ARAVE|nr:Retrovirus-related Pol polyprotein from transposon TNT 1-94 [Araneus ventricosus]
MEQWTTDTASGAMILLRQIDYEFVCLLEMWSEVLVKLDFTNKSLQGKCHRETHASNVLNHSAIQPIGRALPLSDENRVYRLFDSQSQKVQCKYSYIENVLEKFNMQEAKTVKTPLDPNVKLTKEMCPKTEAEKAKMSLYPYWSLIVSHMYLAICTRPDICHAVSYLSQFNENPGMPHWTATKRVKISKSTEAEYIALSECAKEIVYVRHFPNELFDSEDETPTVDFPDSQAAQKLVQNPIFHSRTISTSTFDVITFVKFMNVVK